MNLTRKSLNVLEQPTYPCLQRERPHWYQTKKNPEVPISEIIREQEDNYQSYEHYVLPVSRTENQTKYGKSSYTSKVNKNFRPPLLDPYEDLVALSRQPRPATSARNNPDGVLRDQNIGCQDVSAFIDYKVSPLNAVRAGYSAVKETPIEPPEIFNFRMNERNVSTSVGSGMNTPYQVYSEAPQESLILECKNPSVEVGAGYNPTYMKENFTYLEDLELETNRPSVGVETFKGAPYGKSDLTSFERKNVDYVNPKVSSHAGFNTDIKFNPESSLENLKLEYNRPQISYRASENASRTGNEIYERKPRNLKQQPTLIYSASKIPNFTISQIQERPYIKPTLAVRDTFTTEGVIPTNYLMTENQRVALKLKGVSNNASRESTQALGAMTR